MFSWILDFLGALFSPLWSALYSTLILGALNLLNMTFGALNFVAGSNASNLLFNTEFTNDGTPQLNFFQSESPLRPLFMTMLAVGGALLAVFGMIGIFQAFISMDKKVQFQKIRNVVGSTTGVFLVPLIFMIVLSLFGALMNVMSGERIPLNNKSVAVFQTETKSQIEKFYDGNKNRINTFLEGISDKQTIEGLDKDARKLTLSISEMYKNMNDKEWEWNYEGEDTNVDPISKLAKENQQTLYDIKILVKQPTYFKHLENVLTEINKLKPNKKDEEAADLIRNASTYFMQINNRIRDFQNSAKEILLNYQELELDENTGDVKKYDTNGNEDPSGKAPNGIGEREYAIYNFNLAYNKLFGQDNGKTNVSYNSITNLQQFSTENANLLSGSLGESASGLDMLRQSLSSVEDNSLVVTLYQITTGRRDQIWYEAKWITEPPQMLFIGGIIIAFCIFVMAQNVLYAITRLLNLAMFFVLSPWAIIMSPIDNNASFKGWLKMVMGNLFGIFGVIIVLKVFGLLYQGFEESMNASKTLFQGESGFLLKNFLLAMFGLSGITAAKVAGQQVGSMFGFSAGFSQGLQFREAGAMLKGLGSAMKMGTVGLAMGASKQIGRIAGFTSKANKQLGGSGDGSGGGSGGGALGGPRPLLRQRMRKGIGNAINSRIMKPLSAVSGGKMGSTRSKLEWADYRKRVAEHKTALAKQAGQRSTGKYSFLAGKDPIKRKDKAKARLNHWSAVKDDLEKTPMSRFDIDKQTEIDERRKSRYERGKK